MTVLEDTTSRMECLIQSDRDNRILMEKGATSIQILTEQLENAENTISRQERMIKEQQNIMEQQNNNVAELHSKIHQMSSRVQSS